ncbi:MAG: Nitrate reductase-like protein NarX [Anaerolineales bacterium]|nr:Nitrate reductase-like protein NarX [Anaerolineales bacterium]
MTDFVLFAAFPYVAIVVCVVFSLHRYFTDRYSYSSLSSQFLENRQLFWGSVPWHYGIIIILAAHVLAGLFPGFWARLIADPIRLYFLEVTGFALGFITLFGLAALAWRRLTNKRVWAVTSGMDVVLMVLLLFQVVAGVYVALFYRWGAEWYLYTAVPWLASLFKLNPQVQYVTVLPLAAQLHFLNAFLLIAIFPFTRLVHLVSFPITYLWRPYQVVIWNRRAGVGTEKS